MITETVSVVPDQRLLLLREMDEAIHDLSQPLTSIAFAVELAAIYGDGNERGAMLLSAKHECARAIEHVTAIRKQMAHWMSETKKETA